MDIFQEINQLCEQEENGFYIEPAVGINNEEHTYTPGVHIEAQDTYGPMFFSSAELRAMADEADCVATEMMSRN
jgi:hypothetical protein